MKAVGFARKFTDLSRSKNEGIAALFRVLYDKDRREINRKDAV
jgi:hypothetical protein